MLRLVTHSPEPFTQAALAERLGVLPSQLVALLDELEARGLMQRVRNPADRRSNLLEVTAAGRALMHEVTRLTERMEAELLEPLAPAERAALSGLLLRLAQAWALSPGVHPAYRHP